jgi:hypothetical protein
MLFFQSNTQIYTYMYCKIDTDNVYFTKKQTLSLKMCIVKLTQKDKPVHVLVSYLHLVLYDIIV